MLDVVAHPVVVIPSEEVPYDEARGDRVFQAGRGDLVGREHEANQFVVSAVGGHAADDPVTPAPDLPVAVEHIRHASPAVPVGVSPNVHPMPGPALPVLG